MRKSGYSIAAAAMIGGISLGTAGTALDRPLPRQWRPGNSDFAAHVKASKGPGGHNEGDHQGWSQCQETSNNYIETP